MRVFIFDIWRFKAITNTNSNTLLSGTSGKDFIENNGGEGCTINTGAGNDSVYNDDGHDCTINAGAGNDSVYNWNGWYCMINTGEGNDSVYNDSGNYCTINTGKGNDLISLSSGYNYSSSKENVIVYKSGDGNDTIYGFDNNDTLSISGGSYSTTKNDSNIIVTVDNDKITLVGAASLILDSKIVFTQTVEENSWTLDGTTAKYGTVSKTLVTVKGVKSVDGLSLKNKVVTVSNSSLNQKKVTVSSGYTLNLGSDVTKSTSKAVGWTKSGSTATYKTASTTAGYKLTNNQINYVKKSGGSTLATVKGVKNTTGLSVNNKVVTLKKSSLNSKVTLGGSYSFNLAAGDYKKTSIMGSATADVITSNGKNLSINGSKGNDTIKISGVATTVTGGAGKDVFIYSGGNGRITDFGATDTLRIGNGKGPYSSETSGKNLIVTVGDNEITLVGAANLSSLNIAGTKKTDSEGVTADGKKVTLTEDYAEENFTFADSNSMLTVDASAVELDINIIGNKFMNSILGGAGNDTLTGAKGNDTLDGGDGSDIFIYKAGDGNDTIVNYAEEDKISIASGTVDKISANNKDVVLAVGSGKITVKDAVNKIVTFVEKGKTVGYLNAVMIEGKVATLTDDYTAQTFTAKDKFKSIRTINADAVTHNLKITGSNGGDFIIGGKGKNTLIGGGGSDTLQGGKDTDVFVYDSGNDVIESYTAGDVISVKGAVSDAVEYNGYDVIFSVNNSGTITVAKGKGKKIKLIDKNGSTNKIYNGADMWFIEDDTNFDTDNQLGSIVKSSAAAYPFDTPTDLTSLTRKNNFITYSGGKK